MNLQQREKIKTGKGFIAALDQSGGSTPKALKLYGLDENSFSSEAEMFERIHQMRSRIIKSPAFSGNRILGIILFQRTMEAQIDGVGTAIYLWERKEIVPFLKIDVGLESEKDGVQLMKPIPEIWSHLDAGKGNGIFGTKMRSVVKEANEIGIEAVLVQQFAYAKEIIDSGLVPIIEPEIDINCREKARAEVLLREGLRNHLDRIGDDEIVMLKLTLPEESNYYREFVSHPKVLRVAALSGGYSRDHANELLARNSGVIASFSRALTEGLKAQQSEAEFDAQLDAAISSIYGASLT